MRVRIDIDKKVPQSIKPTEVGVHPTNRDVDAIKALNVRLARGEVGIEEYRDIKKELRQ